MTDIEISKALALAIGWKPSAIGIGQIDGVPVVGINEQASGGANGSTFYDKRAGGWCVEFDYRDPAVIWPIAERYDAYPISDGYNWWVPSCHRLKRRIGPKANTAAKAVAIAVIGAKT